MKQQEATCAGCDKPAEYVVYEQREPHCLACMLDAVDCGVQVLVKTI